MKEINKLIQELWQTWRKLETEFSVLNGAETLGVFYSVPMMVLWQNSTTVIQMGHLIVMFRRIPYTETPLWNTSGNLYIGWIKDLVGHTEMFKSKLEVLFQKI